ncbi:MAG: hypothetical protein ACR2KZ_05680, partial [Segetibacter sp.]
MKNSNKIAFAILALASIGCLTALLVSDKGDKAREKIGKKGKKLWKKTKKTAEHLVEKSGELKDSLVE